MDEERRRAVRRAFLIECSWTRGARITDISASGCYVDTRVVPNVGEHVEFTATIDERTVSFRGIVVSSTPNLGFGIAFDRLPEDTRIVLTAALEKAARVGT